MRVTMLARTGCALRAPAGSITAVYSISTRLKIWAGTCAWFWLVEARLEKFWGLTELSGAFSPNEATCIPPTTIRFSPTRWQVWPIIDQQVILGPAGEWNIYSTSVRMYFDPLECSYCEHPPMKSDLLLQVRELEANIFSYARALLYAMKLLYVSKNH